MRIRFEPVCSDEACHGHNGVHGNKTQSKGHLRKAETISGNLKEANHSMKRKRTVREKPDAASNLKTIIMLKF